MEPTADDLLNAAAKCRYDGLASDRAWKLTVYGLARSYARERAASATDPLQTALLPPEARGRIE